MEITDIPNEVIKYHFTLKILGNRNQFLGNNCVNTILLFLSGKRSAYNNGRLTAVEMENKHFVYKRNYALV